MSHPSFRAVVLSAAVLLSVSCAPAVLHAQGASAVHAPSAGAPATTSHVPGVTPAAPAAPDSAELARPAGPYAGTTAFPTTVRLTPTAATSQDAHVGAGKNVALMGVGAAAVVIGLLVGDAMGTGIAVGGGLLGLYGLYRFLK